MLAHTCVAYPEFCACFLCCAAQIKGFEAIRGVTLDAEQFSVDNDCLTPTFKFKRPQLQKRYQVRT